MDSVTSLGPPQRCRNGQSLDGRMRITRRSCDHSGRAWIFVAESDTPYLLSVRKHEDPTVGMEMSVDHIQWVTKILPRRQGMC